VGALKQQQLDQALGFFEKAAAESPELATAHYYLGVVRGRQGDAEGARRGFEKALQLQPDYAQAHASLAMLHWRQNGPDRGLPEFRGVVMSVPVLGEDNDNLGLALA